MPDVAAASLVALLLGSLRAAAWLVVVPAFGSRAIPSVVKALLSVALALPLVPKLQAHVPSLETGPLIGAVVEQVLIGAALGFLTMLVLSAVQIAGDLIDVTSGFAMSFALDPLGFNQSSVFGRLHQMLSTALLFALNLHVVVLAGFLRSYDALPLDQSLDLESLGRLLTKGIGQVFLSAAEIAGPLVAVFFLADVGLALLTRVAPQLNAFSAGFPLKMLFGLLLVASTFTLLPGVMRSLTDSSGELVTLLVSAR